MGLATCGLIRKTYGVHARGGSILPRSFDFAPVLKLLPLAMGLTLAACDDPPPGLDAPERVEALQRCDVKLAALARTDDQLKRLCDCTTGRLVQQGFTLDDLDNENRDRAMEQVRWCMTQTGAQPLKTPGGIEAPADAVTQDDVDQAAEGGAAEGEGGKGADEAS